MKNIGSSLGQAVGNDGGDGCHSNLGCQPSAVTLRPCQRRRFLEMSSRPLKAQGGSGEPQGA